MSNKKIYGVLSLLLLVFVYAAALPAALPVDASEKEKTILNTILKGLEYRHFTDVQFNDELSQKAFDEYIDRIDWQKKFLTKADVEALSIYRNEIDDQILNGELTLLDVASSMLDQRVSDSQGYYQEILSEPINLEASDFIETDEEKIDRAGSVEELKEIWRKSLRYQVLSRIANKHIDQEKEAEENDTLVLKTLTELEVDARQKVLDRHDSWFKRMEKLNREDRFTTYVNAVIGTLDPHTGYFPPKKKEDFDISISGRLEGIGARLTTEDGYIKVIEIVPGSPSYKQGELAPDDLILKVGQGEEDAVDVVDMRLDDAVQLIRGKKGTEVRLTVRKLDGSSTVIPIIRDIVVNEESYAKSAVLKDTEEGESIGFIHLPKFYTDFTRTGGRTCSEDVKKEIAKLKAQGIDKLILDLRGNGGGSLQDVVDMVGLFIHEGPVVQVKSRDESPYVLEDKDPAIQFDGELVVMVNHFSASASEIFAAAIQDYQRGIIMGSSKTYGKGTVQSFMDLDRFVRAPEASSMKPLGSLKITTQKFYRVNGGATQIKGVESDIVFPDNYSYIEVGEKELDFAMPWSEIKPVDYNSWSHNLELVKQQSAANLLNRETFKRVDDYARVFKERRDETQFPLNFEKYLSFKKERQTESDEYKELSQQKIEDILIAPLEADKLALESDEGTKDRMDDWFEKIEQDIYVKEALEVLGGLN